MRYMFCFYVSLFGLSVINAQELVQPRELVLQLFKATDEKDWPAAADCFAPTVSLDYSSMTAEPKQTLTPSEIITSWKQVLPGFTHTDHQLSNIHTTITGNKAIVDAYGTATHYLEHKNGNVWTVVGTYTFNLTKHDADWEINAMTFNYKYQYGNTALVQHAIHNLKQTTMTRVTFKSEGLELVGNLYYPDNYAEGNTYPAVVVSGSWTTVKEQMAGLYAEKLAKQGFITLAFDFRNFGESEGEPRFFESPNLKKEDIKNAVSYLQTLEGVDDSKIGAFGVCAGAMYTVMAASEDDRIASVVTAASWLHDAEAVKLFYGGEEGVQSKIANAQKAKQTYAETGEVTYIPAISETDENAAMFGPYDYYLNPERGAISEWSNDKFAVASWEDWLTANPMLSAKSLTQPILMIHSDGSVLPNYTKSYFEAVAAKDKHLHWMETDMDSPFHQFNFYDNDAEVNESVTEASAWFAEKM